MTDTTDTASNTDAIRVDVHLAPDATASALAADVRAGLGATPKTLPPKWFYDDRGSALFDEITRLPEYYPTRAERSILEARAAARIRYAEYRGPCPLAHAGHGRADADRADCVRSIIDGSCKATAR